MFKDKLKIKVMQEKILEAFENLGFKMQPAESAGFIFEYEGNKFLYMSHNNDEEFFSISLPSFYDFEEDNATIYNALSEKINSTLKYVKAYTLGNSMWLFYERELLGEDDFEKLIYHMIMHLDAALLFARRTIDELEALPKEGEEENEDDTTDDNNE